MAYFKNWSISKFGLFQKLAYFKNWLISKIVYLKKWPISKINLFQKFFKTLKFCIQLLNSNAESFQLNGKYEEQIRRYETDKQDLMVKLADIESVYAETKQHNTELIVKLQNSESKLDDVLTDIQPKEVKILELENVIKMQDKEITKRLEETKRLREENAALLQSRNCTEINKHLPSCDAIRYVFNYSIVPFPIIVAPISKIELF